MSDIQKDTKKDVSNKALGSTSLLNRFKDLLLNDHHTFLVRKVEKLTSAVYVITGFLPPEEPVRNRLRVCALELVEKSSQPSKLSEDGLGAFIARTSEIGAILQTARSAGLISPMNAELLSEEYANLAEFVKSHVEDIQQSSAAQKEDGVLNVEVLTESYKGQETSKQDKNKKTQKIKRLPNGNKGQGDRKKILIDLLNKKDKISIKDAALVITSCSEKTLQRELLALVEEGIAIKEGERRWSTYRKAVLSPFSP